MPYSQSPSEGKNDLDELFKKVHGEFMSERQVAKQLSHGARIEYKSALSIDAEILDVKDNHVLLDETAHRLSERHNEHWISPAFIKAMIRLPELKADNKVEEINALLAPFREKAKGSGFFLMQYSDELMRQHLLSPNYVIAEASGIHPDPVLGMKKVKAADCQCALPDAKSVADGCTPVIEMPDTAAGDTILEEDLVNRLRENPGCFAEVKDIVTSLSMGKLMLAGAARRCAFRHIVQEVNPQRGAFPIEEVAASIAQIKGIELPDGTRLLLKDFQQNSIKNERSVDIHMNGTYPAVLAFILKDRKVPVIMDGQMYYIIVSWLEYVHNIRVS